MAPGFKTQFGSGGKHSSCLGFPLAIAGLFFGLPFLVNLGIIFYSLAVAFYVITLLLNLMRAAGQYAP